MSFYLLNVFFIESKYISFNTKNSHLKLKKQIHRNLSNKIKEMRGVKK